MIQKLKSFFRNRSGSSTVLMALTLPVMLLAMGGGIDMSRAMSLKQATASSAEIVCKAFAIYYTSETKKNRYPSYDDLAKALAAQLAADNLPGITNAGSFISFSTSVFIVVKAAGSSPNYFGGILGYNTTPISVRRQCPAILPDPPTSIGTVMWQESFETGHSVAPNDWSVLKNWNSWTTQDAGIEINGMPSLSGNSIRFGNFFAELDSHCYVAGCHSNSTMSREMTLTTGTYEIRYWYFSRILNNDPAYANKAICGTEAEMKNYTRDDQTNRIEVFFERQGNYTFDKATSMVDLCIYSDAWRERIIPIKITTAGTYRVSWRAAGREDTVGGLIDYLRFCTKTCP